jgi:hypothetical protein
MADGCIQLKEQVHEENFDCEPWLLVLSDHFD